MATPQEQLGREVPLDEAVEALRRKFRVPRVLVERMVRQESGGNTEARSYAGARGQFQVMPDTLRGVSRQTGKALDISDPLDNAYTGLYLLRQNYDRFRPKARSERHAWGLAVAGYHGNPDNVERTLQRDPLGIPDQGDGLINTRDHVARIFEGTRPEDFAPDEDVQPQPTTPTQPARSTLGKRLGRAVGEAATPLAYTPRQPAQVQQAAPQTAPAPAATQERRPPSAVPTADPRMADPSYAAEQFVRDYGARKGLRGEHLENFVREAGERIGHSFTKDGRRLSPEEFAQLRAGNFSDLAYRSGHEALADRHLAAQSLREIGEDVRRRQAQSVKNIDEEILDRAFVAERSRADNASALQAAVPAGVSVPEWAKDIAGKVLPDAPVPDSLARDVRRAYERQTAPPELTEEDRQQLARGQEAMRESALMRGAPAGAVSFTGEKLAQVGNILRGASNFIPSETLRDAGEYLRRKGAVAAETARAKPEGAENTWSELFGADIPRGVTETGLGLAEIVALRRATGVSFPSILVAESAASNLDKPPERQAEAVREAYVAGHLLEKLNSLGRLKGALAQGAYGTAQAYRQGARGNELLARAVTETGAGAVMGGRRPERPPERPAESADVAIARAASEVPISTPKAVRRVRHSDPRIDGGEVIGERPDGRLEVRNNEGGVSVVKNPRKGGNREAAIVTEKVTTPADLRLDEIARLKSAARAANDEAFRYYDSAAGADGQSPEFAAKYEAAKDAGNRHLSAVADYVFDPLSADDPAIEFYRRPESLRVLRDQFPKIAAKYAAGGAEGARPTVEAAEARAAQGGARGGREATTPPPVPAGHTRFYRADAADAEGPQGRGWANDAEYVSQKYGAGQMGSETVWYIDVPNKPFIDDAGHVPSVIENKTLDIHGIKVEPKLFRRVGGADDTQNVQRVSGGERRGEALVEAGPDARGGREEAPRGGDVQAHAPEAELPAAEGVAPSHRDAFREALARSAPGKVTAEQLDAAATIVDLWDQTYARHGGGQRGDLYRTVASVERATGGDKKGATEFLEDGRSVMRFFQNVKTEADISTYAHEPVHAFLPHLMKLKGLTTDADFARSVGVFEQWMGLGDGEFLRLHEGYVRKSLSAQEKARYEAAQEKAAPAFERYLKTGVAPSVRLNRVFAQFKEWLGGIYGAIRGKNHPLNVKLTPEAIEFFDRSLGGQPKGEHGQTVNQLYRSGFFENASVKRALRLPETASADDVRAALTESEGRVRSSNLHPEMLVRWARQNGVDAEGLAALEQARMGVEAKVKDKASEVEPESPSDAFFDSPDGIKLLESFYGGKVGEGRFRQAAKRAGLSDAEISAIVEDAGSVRADRSTEGDSGEGQKGGARGEVSGATGRGRQGGDVDVLYQPGGDNIPHMSDRERISFDPAPRALEHLQRLRLPPVNEMTEAQFSRAADNHEFAREAERISRAIHTTDDNALPVAIKNYARDFRFTNPGLVRQFSNVQPDTPVKVYRSVSADDPHPLRPGDWVALERDYAAMHGSSGYGEVGGKMVEDTLPARDIAWAGTDANEWVYAPEGVRNYEGTVLQFLKEQSAASPPDAQASLREPRRREDLRVLYQTAPSEIAARAREAAKRARTPDPEKVLARRAESLQSQIADLNRRLAERDLSPRPRRQSPVADTAETARLRAERDALQRQLRELRREERAKAREAAKAAQPPPEPEAPRKSTTLEKISDIANVPRTLKSSIDLSAAGRQGLKFATSHPAKALRIFFGDQMRALRSKGYEDFKRRMAADPDARLMEESGLYLASQADNKPSEREEAFASRLFDTAAGTPLGGKKGAAKAGLIAAKAVAVPVASSNRAYAAFLDAARTTWFKQLARHAEQSAKESGREVTPEDYESVARFVNIATGRGDLGEGAVSKALPLLNSVFFAPRYTVSKLQYFDPRLYARLPAGARRTAVRQAVQHYALLASVLALAKYGGESLGWEVGSDDPTSADFGKLKVGDTRYDLSAGDLQYVNLAARLFDHFEQRGRGVKQDKTALDLISKWARYKLAPIPAAAVNLNYGKNAVGEDVTLKGEAVEAVAPIYLKELWDAYRKEGGLGVAKQVPGFVGAGVQTYKSRPSAGRERSKMKQDFIKGRREGRDTSAEEMQAVRDGLLTREDVRDIRDEAKLTETQAKFKRLGVEEALAAYEGMSPAEREKVKSILRQKRDSLRALPLKQREELRPKFEALTR